MTDARALLERHTPRLAYDSLEAYFADSAAIWTDSPTNVLKRAGGAVLARPPQLSLTLLGPHVYSDGRQVLAADVIGDTTRDYAKHAAALHRDPRYRDRVYGHARRDKQGRLWLQYWLFYYYNDFQLAGPLLSGGKHEGDWEVVQFRLGPSEQPEQAVFSQHKGGQSRPWSGVRKAPGAPATPLVYVARGSHANYFTPGSHWTGVWFDRADGRGPMINPSLEVLGDSEPAWVKWPGFWGDTKPTSSPVDSSSPISPGRRAHWSDPAVLAASVQRRGAARIPPPPQAPAPPRIVARREADRIVVAYEVEPGAAALVVGIRPEGSAEPALTRTVAPEASGEVQLPADAGRPYEVWASVVAACGAASESVRADVP
jgi:hypothetical protein